MRLPCFFPGKMNVDNRQPNGRQLSAVRLTIVGRLAHNCQHEFCQGY